MNCSTLGFIVLLRRLCPHVLPSCLCDGFYHFRYNICQYLLVSCSGTCHPKGHFTYDSCVSDLISRKNNKYDLHTLFLFWQDETGNTHIILFGLNWKVLDKILGHENSQICTCMWTKLGWLSSLLLVLYSRKFSCFDLLGSVVIFMPTHCKASIYMISPENRCEDLFHPKLNEPPQDKTNKMMCAQQRLRSAWASTQSDQSSLSAWRNLGSLSTHWVHSEDSDQTGWMPRLIWVFTGRTGHFVGFVMRRLKCLWLVRTNCQTLVLVKLIIKWALSREKLLMPYMNDKDTDQPAHLRSLIGVFCCSLSRQYNMSTGPQMHPPILFPYFR